MWEQKNPILEVERKTKLITSQKKQTKYHIKRNGYGYEEDT